MARVSTTDDLLVVELQDLHPLWARRRRITVPLVHVRGANAVEGGVGEPGRRRGPGARSPGRATVGTFEREGQQDFWDVDDGARAVVVELVDEPWARLVLQVDDPRAVADSVTRALTRAVDPPEGTPARTAGTTDGGDQDEEPLGPGWRAVVVVATAVQVALVVGVLRDLARRPAEQVRGSKRFWRLAAFFNYTGPVAYLAVGRRR